MNAENIHTNTLKVKSFANNSVLIAASEKLNINGSTIVLESDGTAVTEDDILQYFKAETLILLEPNEEWMPVGLGLSLCSTVTASSSCSSISSPPGDNHLKTANIATEQNIQALVEETGWSLPSPDASVSEGTWMKFLVPWDRVGKEAIKNCEAGIRDRRTRTEVIHATVNALREIRRNVPCKALKIAAQKIISKYPKVFEDRDDDGVLLGDGSVTVYQRLLERMNYLNRKRKDEADSKTVHISKRKNMLPAKAGCANWQPILESNPSLEEIQEKLKNVDENFDQETLEWLEITYPAQRIFLNDIDNPPSVDDVKKEWPILLSSPGILWHYQKLMNNDACTLSQKIIEKSEKIIKFGIKQKFIDEIPEDIPEDIIIATLKIIAGHFHENYDSLLHYIHVSNKMLILVSEIFIATYFILYLNFYCT